MQKLARILKPVQGCRLTWRAFWIFSCPVLGRKWQNTTTISLLEQEVCTFKETLEVLDQILLDIGIIQKGPCFHVGDSW